VIRPVASSIWLLFIASLVACATNERYHTAPVKDPDQIARITYLHNYSKRGASVPIAIDGIRAAKVSPGRHITLDLDPGVHSLAVGKSLTTYELKPGEHQYFLICGTSKNVRVEPLDRGAARSIMASYRNVP
jgi:hypothetical protein